MIKEFLSLHGEYHDDRSFRELTSLKMGGHISHFVMPGTTDDLKTIVSFLIKEKIPFKVIGNGSNLLCGEKEYEGVVISLKKLNGYEIRDDHVYAQAGMMVPVLAGILAKKGYSCLEFASGIPGCIGGLVYMNAGAYRSCMADVIEEVQVLRNDNLLWLSSDEMDLSYRHSVLHDHRGWVVTAAKLKLEKKPAEEIEELMADRLRRRRMTQPLDKPSAGSCFRNPDDVPAWQLIDGIGYRGFSLNDVCVSEKHSNFIVNNGNGTAQDFLEIVSQIQEKVDEKYGIRLVMEVEKFNC